MDRRHFLKSAGLASVGLPVLLSGCDITDSKTETEGPKEGDDIAVLQKVVKMEGVAVATYNAAAALITTPAYQSVAESFRDSHKSHAVYINNILFSIGGAQIDFLSEVPDIRASSVTDELSVLNLAARLEFEASEAYFKHMFESVIFSKQAREALANIYPVEVQHYLTFRSALGDPDAIKYALFSTIKRP
ncbi:MAG: ferritin-like domain-containing protein [Bacteroidetes bacterium]|nr:ferritin-like domain-containing protein [Bacteroidota bacterium]